MSGGRFDYQQYRMDDIADQIELLIEQNYSREIDEYGEMIGRNYPAPVVQRFREAVTALRKACIYTHEIDWLVSGDTGEESFEERLSKKLSKIDEEQEA